MNPGDTLSSYLTSEIGSLFDQAESIRKAVDLVKPLGLLGNSFDTGKGLLGLGPYDIQSLNTIRAVAPTNADVVTMLGNMAKSLKLCPDALTRTVPGSHYSNLAPSNVLAEYDRSQDRVSVSVGESWRAFSTPFDKSGLLGGATHSYTSLPRIETYAPYVTNITNVLQQNNNFINQVTSIDCSLALMSNLLLDSIKSNGSRSMLFGTALQTTGLLGNLANLTQTAARISTELAQLFPTNPTMGLNFKAETPFVEAFTSSHLVERLTHRYGQAETPMPARQRVVDEIKSTTDEGLAKHLSALDPTLARMMTGARRARHSSNPERSRHVSISLRELFTAVLHALAPDQQVIDWVTDPELIKDGRPTRSARVLFVCRRINSGPCSGFVRSDVKLTCSVFDALQAGTHSREQQLTESQLDALLLRVETQLLFLLEIAKLA